MCAPLPAFCMTIFSLTAETPQECFRRRHAGAAPGCFSRHILNRKAVCNLCNCAQAWLNFLAVSDAHTRLRTQSMYVGLQYSVLFAIHRSLYYLASAPTHKQGHAALPLRSCQRDSHCSHAVAEAQVLRGVSKQLRRNSAFSAGRAVAQRVL
jgi:hypothetical protein